MWRSLLFFSRTALTELYSEGFTLLSLYATSLCTVLLLIPKRFAVSLTVALCSIIYAPRAAARSSTVSIISSMLFFMYMRAAQGV